MKKVILIYLLIFVNLYAEFSFEIYYSNYSSKSSELVYNDDYSSKISELIWRAMNINLLGTKLIYSRYKNSEIVFDIKMNINDNNSAYMDDYDWLYGANWSHWSTHPNTIAKSIEFYELYYLYQILSTQTVKINILTGYSTHTQSFKAYDGSFIYSSSATSLRDQIFTSTGLGISYSESFNLFFMGLETEYTYNNLLFGATLKYGFNSNASNEDTHHNRKFTNYNTYEELNALTYIINIDYLYSKNTTLFIKVQHMQYKEAHGKTTRVYDSLQDARDDADDQSLEYTTFIYNGAGLKSENFEFNFGMKYLF